LRHHKTMDDASAPSRVAPTVALIVSAVAAFLPISGGALQVVAIAVTLVLALATALLPRKLTRRGTQVFDCVVYFWAGVIVLLSPFFTPSSMAVAQARSRLRPQRCEQLSARRRFRSQRCEQLSARSRLRPQRCEHQSARSRLSHSGANNCRREVG
jgi:hypothetical protein